MGDAGKNRIYGGVIVVMIIVLCVQGLQGIYGFSLFPDEFGYWMPAAALCGYDWTQTVATGSYYSFGYSILLAPFLRLFQDSVTAYRAAVCLNLCLQAGGFVLLCGIAKRLFSGTDGCGRVLLCGFAVLYPAWTFYTQMTMAEGLLFFLYPLSVWVLIRYTEKPDTKKTVLFALVLCYLYTVHTRTVGILVAGMITVAVSAFRERGAGRIRHPAVFYAVTGALFLTSLYLKDGMIAQLYVHANPDLVSVNDYAGQTWKIAELLSPAGLLQLIASVSGKLLYLGCASFGTAYIGAVTLVKRAHAWLKPTEDTGTKRDGSVVFFLILTAVLQFGIVNVYLVGSANRESRRLDLFLHGRYFDFVIPLLMMTGLYTLLTEEGYFKKTAVSCGLMTALALCATTVLASNHNGMDDPRGEMMIGMSYLLAGDGAQPVWFPLAATAVSVVFAGLIAITAYLYRKEVADTWLFLPVALHILLGLHVCHHFILTGQANSYGDIRIADSVLALQEARDGRIVHLYEGGRQYVDTVQFRLRERQVMVFSLQDGMKDLSILDADDYVLVHFESDYKEMLGNIYDARLETGHFDLYYNMN